MSSNLPQVRAMKKKEVDAMRAEGCDPGVVATDDARVANSIGVKMVDWILANIYSEHDFDDVPYDQCLTLAGDTYAKTMGRPTATKNS